MKSVVDTSVPNGNTVNRVDISGDMTACVGEQMRVEVQLEDGSNVWAVHNMISPVSLVSLNLDPTTGAFYDTNPIADGGVLQVTGSRVAAVPVADFGVITVTIAKTWE